MCVRSQCSIWKHQDFADDLSGSCIYMLARRPESETVKKHKINIKITSQPVPKIRKKNQNLNTLTKLHVNSFIQYFHVSSSMFSEPKDVQCLLTSVKLKNRLIPPTKRRASSAYVWIISEHGLHVLSLKQA